MRAVLQIAGLLDVIGKQRTAKLPRKTRFPLITLEFPRRNPNLIYFPTKHVHDGQVHSHATFDHELYCQFDDSMLPKIQSAGETTPDGWLRSDQPAGAFLKHEMPAGLLDLGAAVFRQVVKGEYPNRDIEVD